MVKFHLHDTVALREDRTFVGSVERTSQFESEPLDDCLIINHTEVPADVIRDFVYSGTPPSGYVFVQFASQEKGSSLVAEDELILIDRIFELGDVVKQNTSQLTGTVINVSSSYVLDPIWQPRLTNDEFAAKPVDQNTSRSHHVCDLTCSPLHPQLSHACPHRLIPNVPFEELKRAQDFIEGDYVIEHDWLGVVDAVEMLVVVKLENNSVVVVAEPEDLFIPIPDYGKPLVSLPEYDGLNRPHYVSAMQGYGCTIPPEDLECGQFVVTNPRNLKNGRWLRGSYQPSVKPEGRVLMVRCYRLGVQWLMCNAFTPKHHWDATKPEHSLPYENPGTFIAPQELRRHRRLALYDPSKHVPFVQDRRRAISQLESIEKLTKNSPTINLSSSFNVGQKVKFRDAAGAAVKYQGREVNSLIHGRFDRILHNETLGYDLNEFDIVQSQQKAIVRWQDGSITEHPSIELNKTNLFEADLMPADIVVAREGMKQRQKWTEEEMPIEYPLVDFNEMTFFEKPHDLFPAKVGVIQCVSPAERVATVRWFQSPIIRITISGNALGGESRFGPIGDEVEDVSLYEVMSFNGLVRKIRDIVIIPPSSVSQLAVEAIKEVQQDDFAEVDASVTTLSQIPDRHPAALLEWMQHNARKTLDDLNLKIVEPQLYKSHRSLDWSGEICQLRTDGLVVLRVNIDDQARDILIEHDQILSLVDEHIWGFDYNEDPMDIDDSDTDQSHLSNGSEKVVAEVVEYEGGQRIDNDPGDDNWESEDELTDVQDQMTNGSVHISDAYSSKPSRMIGNPHQLLIQNTEALSASAGIEKEDRPVMQLASYIPTHEPPGFACLDRDPPLDQFRASENPQTSTTFLKRIAKEHRILSSSLPKHEIYVRTYDSRLDLLRCLIIGPLDTPYEHAPFLIDLHLGPHFPREPPTAHFHSWTSGMGRINPNLYEEGKICLSLLGTWPGKSESEGWTEKATILQLLVSLQGLVFVKAPFFNEAGFEGYEQTREYQNESLQYSEKAYVMGRNFVKHALSSPVGGLEDVLAWIYLFHPKEPHSAQSADMLSLQNSKCMLQQIISRSQSLIDHSEVLKESSRQPGAEDDGNNNKLLSGDGTSNDDTKVFLRPLSKGAFVMLSKTLKVLDGILKHAKTGSLDTEPTNLAGVEK